MLLLMCVFLELSDSEIRRYCALNSLGIELGPGIKRIVDGLQSFTDGKGGHIVERLRSVHRPQGGKHESRD